MGKKKVIVVLMMSGILLFGIYLYSDLGVKDAKCEGEPDKVFNWEKYEFGKLKLDEKRAVENDNSTNGNFYMFSLGALDEVPNISTYIYDILNDKFYLIDGIGKEIRSSGTLIKNGIAFEQAKEGSAFGWFKYDLLTNKVKNISNEKTFPVFYENKMICYEDDKVTDEESKAKYGKIIEINTDTKKQREIADKAWLWGNDKTNIYYLSVPNEKMYRYSLIDGEKYELSLPNAEDVDYIYSNDAGTIYVIYENKDVVRIVNNEIYEKVGNLGKDYKYLDDSLDTRFKGNTLYMHESGEINDSVLFKMDLNTCKRKSILTWKQLKSHMREKNRGNKLVSTTDIGFCDDYIALLVSIEDEEHPSPSYYLGDDYCNQYLLIYDYNGKLIRTRTLQEWR